MSLNVIKVSGFLLWFFTSLILSYTICLSLKVFHKYLCGYISIFMISYVNNVCVLLECLHMCVWYLCTWPKLLSWNFFAVFTIFHECFLTDLLPFYNLSSCWSAIWAYEFSTLKIFSQIIIVHSSCKSFLTQKFIHIWY